MFLQVRFKRTSANAYFWLIKNHKETKTVWGGQHSPKTACAVPDGVNITEISIRKKSTKNGLFQTPKWGSA
jgi:hypothetical protein